MFCIIVVLYNTNISYKTIISQRYIAVPYCLLDVLYYSAR